MSVLNHWNLWKCVMNAHQFKFHHSTTLITITPIYLQLLGPPLNAKCIHPLLPKMLLTYLQLVGPPPSFKVTQFPKILTIYVPQVGPPMSFTVPPLPKIFPIYLQLVGQPLRFKGPQLPKMLPIYVQCVGPPLPKMLQIYLLLMGPPLSYLWLVGPSASFKGPPPPKMLPIYLKLVGLNFNGPPLCKMLGHLPSWPMTQQMRPLFKEQTTTLCPILNNKQPHGRQLYLCTLIHSKMSWTEYVETQNKLSRLMKIQ